MGSATLLEPGTRSRAKTRRAARWHVVLLDDDDHTYDYVVEMLGDLLGHSVPAAFRMAVELDTTGRVIVWTGERARAERRRRRIHAYGADARLPRSQGAMSAVLERAD